MRGVLLIFLLFRVSDVFGQNIMKFTEINNKPDSVEALKTNTDDTEKILNEEANDTGSSKLLLLGSFSNPASPAIEKDERKTKSQTTLHSAEGRKLAYKKTEQKFLMKLFIMLKVVLGLILPLGIIASKILSWKAVTLSLMAFMLAKISFVKNLLMGKNLYSVTPTNLVPPFLIQGASSDIFWKRQGDAQNAYQWNST